MTADIPDHRDTLDTTGLFNAMRHIDLLYRLTARIAAGVEYQLAPDTAALPPATTLTASADHLGQAIAHHTQALAPLIALAATRKRTLRQKLDALDHHSSLRIHLLGGGQVLAAARAAQEGHQSRPTVSASAPARRHDATVRRRT
ncbi:MULTISPECIES: hypothetical protein [unclassified Streptomyces]|uniref:hypothetical protein n=1 Tax=unclassified Streptomyces TaxID=2593676 RepID=UPI00403C5611